MPNKYGSENFAVEFRDLQATTMSIDRSGTYALLAGRKYLTILDLNSPTLENPIARVSFGGKYDISITQWSHIDTTSNVVAVASSQRCDIYELTQYSELRNIQRLKCHTRVITDLDWSVAQANLLATSSFDSYVNIWDLRANPQVCDKPQVSLSALDGASQVKWHKRRSDVLASCDGGHVKIWDLRKPTMPAEYIAAHASKINGLEWGVDETVITAAQDCTVKFNKLAASNPGKVKGPCLSLTAPVWRARPAPFGRGIITQCVPLLRRDSGLLSLWDWKRFSSPIFAFPSYDIIEFAWKRAGNSYDLLTWSRDQTLRIWTLPREVVEVCGEDSQSLYHNQSQHASIDDLGMEDMEMEDDDFFSSESPNSQLSIEQRINTRSLERKEKKLNAITRRDEVLKGEFQEVESNKPENVVFEQEVDRGLLRFSWKPDPKGRNVLIVILASFPIGYPAIPPTFLVTSGGNEVDKSQILKALKQTASQFARKNEPSLSACINQFSTFMRLVKIADESDSFSAFPSLGVANVPFPRTSGARFCSVGMLICFGRPAYLKRVKSNSDTTTPRSLSALGPYLNQLAHENQTTSTGRGHRRSRRLEKKRAGLVTLFDVSPLLPFNKDLACNYRHLVPQLRLREGACGANAHAANGLKKNIISNSWQATALVMKFSPTPTDANTNIMNQHLHLVAGLHPELSEEEEDANWIVFHPLGNQLVDSMISHFAVHGDVQTAATMSCLTAVPEQANSDHVIRSRCGTLSRSQNLKKARLTVPKWWTKGLGSPYHTVHGSDSLHGAMLNPLSECIVRQHRSNSWSDSLDDIKVVHAQHHTTTSNVAAMISGLTSQLATVLNVNGGSNGHKSQRNSQDQLLPLPVKMRNPKIDSIHPFIIRLYDCYKKSYGEILYRWGLLQQRAEVLKCLSEIGDNQLTMCGVDYVIDCRTCVQQVNGPRCPTCRRLVSVCAVCRVPAKGLSTFCSACGHGGHSRHILDWFKVKKTCPTGCGCNCLVENTRNFKHQPVTSFI